MSAAEQRDFDPLDDVEALATTEADRLEQLYAGEDIKLDFGGYLQLLWRILIERKLASTRCLGMLLAEKKVLEDLQEQTIYSGVVDDVVAAHHALGRVLYERARGSSNNEATRIARRYLDELRATGGIGDEAAHGVDRARSDPDRFPLLRLPEPRTFRIPDREGTTFVASEQMTDQERSARRDQIVETGILRLVGRPTTAHQASSVSLASVLTRCGVEARLENVVPLGRDQVDLVSGFQTGPRGEVPAGTIFFCRRCARAAWAAYERQREQGRT